MSHCDFDESCLDILIFNNVVLHDVDMRAPRKCTHSTHWGVCRHSLGSSLLKVTVHPNIKNSVGVYSPSCDGKSAEAS